VAGSDDLVAVRAEHLPLLTASDVVLARHRVRERAIAIGFDLITQTKIVTATSELARNAITHGRGGEVGLAEVHRTHDPAGLVGLRLIFADTGPGIADLDLAMTSGWTSGNGLGLGLPGSRRLVHEFEISSEVGGGTTITVLMWQRPR
jgi:serine/threonine-protein kinase RsbT